MLVILQVLKNVNENVAKQEKLTLKNKVNSLNS